MKKYLSVLILCFFGMFLKIGCLYASWAAKEMSEYGKMDAKERFQHGTTYQHYTDEFIAECEDKYYKRPEVPFVLGLLEIKEGMIVGDIGCGVGSYTFAIAAQAGKTGRVYAVDIQEKMIEVVKRHMQDNNQNLYNNIIAYANRVDDVLIPKHTLDIAWVSMLHFHNFPVLYKQNIAMIQSIYDSLKAGGKLVIADEPNEHIKKPIPNIIKHYRQAGFILVRGPIQDPIIKTSYYLIFKKPDRGK